MADPSREQLRDELKRLLHRGDGVHEFSLGAARILARAVPFDGVCVLTIDPATLLPTGEVVENGLPPAATLRMAEIEIRGQDVNAFRVLARAPRHAATLSQATNGDLDRSLRHREVRRPHGLGDELRAALVDDATTWGALTLMRGADQPDFAPGDADIVASLTEHLAEGLRRGLLTSALQARPADGEDSVGFLVLAPDNSILQANAAARSWLAELRGPTPSSDVPPASVGAVASRARDIARAPDTGAIARVRVRTASGRWLLVRGSTVGENEEAVVTVEPAHAHQLAPLIADAYELTTRERAVTQLVAQGLATSAIAERLSLSPWTVQDHLKAIFEKVGVGSRGELIAQVFFEQDVPRLTDGAPASREG
jgi:DNA-binding CsgD family transcriptional regulator